MAGSLGEGIGVCANVYNCTCTSSTQALQLASWWWWGGEFAVAVLYSYDTTRRCRTIPSTVPWYFA